MFGIDILHEFEESDPYLVLWSIFYNTEVKNSFSGPKRIKVEHPQSGTSLTVTVDFDGMDEDGFSAPIIVNPGRLDAWIVKCEGAVTPRNGEEAAAP